MKQSPDDLFRRRLKDHRLTPPPPAWSRIESSLPGNRRNLWIKIAATLLLLLTTAALVTLVRDNHIPQPVAEDHNYPKANPPRLADSTSDGNEAKNRSAVPKEAPETTAEAPSTQERPVDQNETTKNDLRPERIDNLLAVGAPTHDAHVTIELTPDSSVSAAPLPTDVAEGEDTSFKLILEVDEVQAKYLRKKSVAHATGENTQPSGLKKLLDKANDISNQDHIGDLRQIKNEIFALNFQGKKRDQHK